MAKWRAFSLKDIIEKIEEKRLVLPVIQRNLVWKDDQVTSIFDTLFRGHSFGGIMTIEDQEGQDPLFAYRQFIKDYTPVSRPNSIIDKLSKNVEYVIDGQQRLSAFYIGIKGTYDNKILYFNILSDYENKDFNFQFAVDEKKLPHEIDRTNGQEKQEALWIKVSDLYDGIINAGNSYKGYLKCSTKLNNHDEKETIRENLEIFQQEVITSENIGIAKVQADRTKKEEYIRNEIVELFRRLNQGGTKLSALELMASKLKGFNSRNEKFLYDVPQEETFKIVGFGQDEVLKLTFLLQGNANKNITDISEADSKFIQDNESKLKDTVTLLSQYPKLRELDIPTIPKYFIAYHLFYKDNPQNYFAKLDTNPQDFRLLDRWLKISLLNPYIYSKSGAGWRGDKTGVRKILEVLKQNKGQCFPYKQIVNVYRTHGYYGLSFEEEITVSNIDRMDRSFIFKLLYLNEENIRTRQNDLDHIQPRYLVSGIEFDIANPFTRWRPLDDIGNLQYLYFSTNRSKKDRELYKWLNDPDYVEDKKIFIKKHLIPEDEELWKLENFKEFCEARRVLIVNRINEILNL